MKTPLGKTLKVARSFLVGALLAGLALSSWTEFSERWSLWRIEAEVTGSKVGPPGWVRSSPTAKVLARLLGMTRDQGRDVLKFDAPISRVEAGFLWTTRHIERSGIDRVLRTMGRRALPLLINTLTHPDVEVQVRAVWALSKIGPDAAELSPALVELQARPVGLPNGCYVNLASGPELLRFAATQALARIRAG